MKIRVNTSLLTESPYQSQTLPLKLNEGDGDGDPIDITEEKKPVSAFTFKPAQLEALSNEIVNSNPTSLLISGFRGVGKTSFIEKLEEQILDHKNGTGTIFVKLNFSKYVEYKFIIRKLIRNLYLSVKKSRHWPEEAKPIWHRIFLKKRQSDTREHIKISKELREELDSLYTNTYLQVSEQLSVKKEENIEVKNTQNLSIDSKTVQKLLEILLYGAGSGGLLMGWASSYTVWIGGALGILSLVKAFEVVRTVTKSNKQSKTYSLDKSSIYDDEIADYLFTKVINKLEHEKIRLVFVLDELDKIQKEEDINKVINELKPFFLSGKCNYILVSGQDLYYQYFKSSTENDPVISSIFSRFHHIGLPADLFDRIDDLMTLEETQGDKEKTQKEKEEELFYNLKQAVIFDAHRLPRRMVSILRKTIAPYQPEWEDGYAIVNIDDSEKDRFELKKKFEQAITKTANELSGDSVIAENKPIRDLFIDQLYIWANELLFMEEGNEYGYTDLLQNVSPWKDKLERLQKKRAIFLMTFLNDLEQVGIITYTDKEKGLSFSVNLSNSEIPKQATKSKSIPDTTEREVKTDDTPKPKNTRKSTNKNKSEKTAEPIVTEPSKSSLKKPTARSKKPVDIPDSIPNVEHSEFLQSYDSLLDVVNLLLKSLVSLANLNIQGVDTQEIELPEFTDDAIENLITLTSVDNEFDQIVERFAIPELADNHRAIINDEKTTKPPANFHIRISRIKKDLLRALFLFSFSRKGLNIDSNLHIEDTVAERQHGRKFPNLDLFIENHQDGAHVAMKFITQVEVRTVDQAILQEGGDFLTRVKKITGTTSKLLFLFWWEHNPAYWKDYAERLQSTFMKIAPEEASFVKFECVIPGDSEKVISIYKDIRKVVREYDLHFGKRYFPDEITTGTNNLSDISFSNDRIMGGFTRIKEIPDKDPMMILFTKDFLGNSIIGAPHIRIVFRFTPNQSYQIILHLEHNQIDSEGNIKVGFALSNNPITGGNNYIPFKQLDTAPAELEEGWMSYDINIFREFQNSFWADDDYKLAEVRGLEIRGSLDLSSISLYFDEDNHSFDEIEIMDR